MHNGLRRHTLDERTAPVVHLLFVIADADIVARWAEGTPGDVKPAVAGQELVGVFTGAKEVDQTLELLKVLGSDVGSQAEQVLGVLDTTNQGVHARVAEAGVDDDGADLTTGGFQQHQAAVGHVRHVLHGGFVVGVFDSVDEFRQIKVLRESNVIELCVFH